MVAGSTWLAPKEDGRTVSEMADEEARLRRAAVEISLATERERRAIAGEVHDNIAQELAIAKLRLGPLCAEATGEQAAALEEVRARVADALAACRALTYELASPTLYKLGLAAALRNLVADFRQGHRLSITAHVEDAEIDLPTEAQIILYRVVRELLLNVVKHAGASQVELSVRQDAAQLHIDLSDNGVGFDAATCEAVPSADNGLGLFLVRERLRHLGGDFSLRTAPGRGAQIRITSPLASPPGESG